MADRSQPMPREWGDRTVCYVCATRKIDPSDCRSVNVIIDGFGVCLDDIIVIEHASRRNQGSWAHLNTFEKTEIIRKERDHIDNVRGVG